MARTGRPRGFDRDAALDAAMHLFWEHGFEPTTLNMLKEAMGGISPTSFYAAFGSKEALFREVVERYRVTHGSVTDILRDESLPPREVVETCLRRSVAMQTDASHPIGCLVTQAATNCGPENQFAAEVLSAERRANFDAIFKQVERDIASGHMPPDTDAHANATLFSTFMVGIATSARDGASREALERAVSLAMASWSVCQPTEK
ncbi:TetR/AcrR family transcriptional regulator [Salipiger sp. IMCC34102]|uniref:TetR/AcrR family transcriptional regulator n=1 Tax=Salipiger sp. IMCC34102 TaxID=2510647 RepID=UPI00101C508F|nr:TetR/AcrR family transcriptional regulator [Salipiger sp. IMCC34102]RYH00891.1 TetR/AcrR family transcriptional regulator [Salipiger sp. IMCC34102]